VGERVKRMYIPQVEEGKPSKIWPGEEDGEVKREEIRAS
jgi:hypothetical protein